MQIYISKNNQQLGPFEEAKVLEMIRNGQLSVTDFGIRQGQTKWQKLGEMFPSIQPVWVVPNGPINQPGIALPKQPTPVKPGSSKGVMFGLLGCGGLLLVGIIGVIAFSVFSGKRTSPVSTNHNTVSNSNSNSNANSNITKPTPIDTLALKNKAEELAKLSPPQKLNPKAKLEGKITVVEKGQYSAEIVGSNQSKTKAYGIPHENLANTPEEIDSLVQIICTKGRRIGSYQGNITAYASNCKVSLIDYRNNFIFAQKTLINSELEDSVSSVYDDGDYINIPPLSEIEAYLKGFVPPDASKGQTVITDASQLPVIEDSKTFASEPDKFGKLKFPLKPDPNATIKGKITTIQDDEDADYEYMNSGTMIGISREGTLNPPLPNAIILTKESLGFTDEQIAMKSSEIETLIQVRCKRGNLITRVKGISVFSNICTVNIIDYKALAIVAQKIFEGKKVNNERYTVPSDYEDKKDTVEFPRSEIEEYIKAFPKG